jgi:polyisoprenoid-binding protein YceI
MKRLLLALASLGLLAAARAEVVTYKIDSAHSTVGFTVRHNLVSKVPGSFAKFSGAIAYDEAKPEASSVEATIDVGSITTSNERRDNDLRSPNFFDATKFTTITFKSTAWKKTGDNAFEVSGDLTIRGVTKPVVLKVTLNGTGPGMGGSTVSGWEATTTLNRRDYGVDGPAMLGKVVGDEVTVNLTIEAGYKKA